VPTIVRFPGRVAAGTSNDSASYFADWFPTLSAAVNVPNIAKSQELDGENLWPTLTSGQPLANRRWCGSFPNTADS
jgi:arylsulfatase A-like enzyme